MQVFSSEQFQRLIDHSPTPYCGDSRDNLLDIGAGDGSTTDRMATYFKNVYVTEMSTTMKWTLQKKGYHVLDVADWATQETKFDVITCLNVLDRCEKPVTLLNQIKNALKPGGIAVLAFVIPFKPYVEFGEDKTHEPSESLNITDKYFEGEVTNFVKKVLEPQGFDLIKWTRLPYLCDGDIKQAFYWLDDVVFVVKPAGKIPVQPNTSINTCPKPSTSRD